MKMVMVLSFFLFIDSNGLPRFYNFLEITCTATRIKCTIDTKKNNYTIYRPYDTKNRGKILGRLAAKPLRSG